MKVFYYLLFALAVLAVSCEDPTDVGSGVIPDDDALKTDSTIINNFVLNIYRDDSILNSNSSTVQVGQYNNATFGRSMATYYTEVYYDGTFNQVENAVLDSMIMYLYVSGFQGDEASVQTINVYELTEQLKSSTSDNPDLYYIHETIEKGDLITQFQDVSYNTLDTLVNGSDTIRQLKNYVPTEFAQQIFDKLNDSETNAESFQDFLKGFAFEAEANTAAKGWFNINTNEASPRRTGLLAYYHDAEGTEYSDYIPFYVINDYIDDEDNLVLGAQNFTAVNNTYTDADAQILTQLNAPTSVGYEQAYIQAGNGLYSTINFPTVMSAIPANSKINIAELSINVDLTDNLSDTLFLPTALYLAEGFVTNAEGEATGEILGIDGSGLSNTANLTRFDSRSSSYRIKNDIGKYEYLFRFPKTIQSMVDGVIEPKLHILSGYRANSYNGVKFNTANTELKIFYTETE